MIGCLFVVDREYFGDIGLLDSGMEVYGGENVELGMRVSVVVRSGFLGRVCVVMRGRLGGWASCFLWVGGGKFWIELV